MKLPNNIEAILSDNGWKLRICVSALDQKVPVFIANVFRNTISEISTATVLEYIKGKNWSMFFLISAQNPIFYLFWDESTKIAEWKIEKGITKGIELLDLQDFIERMENINEKYILFE